MIGKKVSTETLSEEVKPVAFENYEFETLQKRINWTFSHVQPINILI